MNTRTLFDPATGRTRTITTLGSGVQVRERARERAITESEALALRSARRARGLSARADRLAARQADVLAKRERLRMRLRGPGGEGFMRAALLALIDRGMLDHMEE